MTQEVEALASVPGTEGRRRLVARSLLKGFRTQGPTGAGPGPGGAEVRAGAGLGPGWGWGWCLRERGAVFRVREARQPE